jgi:flagellar basal body-associated protein FliL
MQIVKNKDGDSMGSFKRILIIILIVVLLFIIGMFGFAAYKLGIIPSFTSKTEEQKKEYTYSLGEFTANLNEQKRYIKISLTLSYDTKKLDKELVDKTPQIRDAVNNVLRTKKAGDVGSSSNIEALKKELKDNLNKIVTAGKINNIYIDNILIQ